MESSAPHLIAGLLDHIAISWIVKLNTHPIRDNVFASIDMKHFRHLQTLNIHLQTD